MVGLCSALVKEVLQLVWMDSSDSYRCNLEQVCQPGLQVAWVSSPDQYMRRWWLSRFLIRDTHTHREIEIHEHSCVIHVGNPLCFSQNKTRVTLQFCLSTLQIRCLMAGWANELVWYWVALPLSSINLHYTKLWQLLWALPDSDTQLCSIYCKDLLVCQVLLAHPSKGTTELIQPCKQDYIWNHPSANQSKIRICFLHAFRLNKRNLKTQSAKEHTRLLFSRCVCRFLRVNTRKTQLNAPSACHVFLLFTGAHTQQVTNTK